MNFWNLLVFTLCLTVMVGGGLILFFTPELLQDVVRKNGLQLIVLTITLPIILFLLAMEKVSKEAGLAIVGTIVGYAFGTGE